MSSTSGRSLSPRSQQAYQGWLKKKGKKRWFILQNNSLYWFAKEQKAVTFHHNSVKGCLELKGYAVSVNHDKPHTFIVSNLREMNYYELTAASDESMHEWIDNIRLTIAKAGESDVAGEEHYEKRGVLTKKGQDRLFVLKSDSLMWFLSKTGAEKKAKGSLPLQDVTIKRGPKGYSFVLQPKVGKAYVLFASNQSECDEWMAAINKVIDVLSQNQTTIKNGWLEKKGQKRYFVIKNGKLLWFNKMQKDDSAEANGYLLLESCTVEVLPPANGKYALRITSLMAKLKREYTLTATSETECNDWVAALVSGGATASTSTLGVAAPLRRFSILNTQGEPPPAGSIQLSDGSYIRRSSSASDYNTSSDTQTRQSSFLVAEKSGWLDKKGKRRWFVLKQGELAWYNQPHQHEKGERPNGSISAKDASVAQIGEIGNGYFVFAVYSTAKETEYLLQASSLNEMEDWIVALVLAGASPEKERGSAATVDEGTPSIRADSLPEHDKNGWMEKKGRKRWFVARNNRLYWYKAVQETDAGLREPTGSLDLKECSVKKLDEKLKGKSALLISSSSQGDYLLLHQDEEEINSWVKVLIERGGASKYTAKSENKSGQVSTSGGYFGLSLQDLLAKEARGSGIPILVEKCVNYIRQHGMETEGIFRVSGEQIDIVALKQEFQSTADTSSIQFPPNTDVHAVSGLLKMFFRELNPPLMTYELYSEFMSAAGCVLVEIKGLINKLPPENKILLQYLLYFLYDVAQLGDIHKMRPMNLAIVFSPNLFRSDKSAFEVLANSSNAATITQFIISHAHELFPNEHRSAVSPPTLTVESSATGGPPPLPSLPALPPDLPPFSSGPSSHGGRGAYAPPPPSMGPPTGSTFSAPPPQTPGAGGAPPPPQRLPGVPYGKPQYALQNKLAAELALRTGGRGAGATQQ